MTQIRESAGTPLSDVRIACIARSLVASKHGKTGNTGVHTNLFARAGQDYTIAFIRQQSLSSIGFLERLPMNPPEKPLEQMYIAFSPSASEAGPAKNLYLRDRSTPIQRMFDTILIYSRA